MAGTSAASRFHLPAINFPAIFCARSGAGSTAGEDARRDYRSRPLMTGELVTGE